MNKIAKIMTLALVLFSLASCEDVPSPYGTVTPPSPEPESSDIEPTGSGTATDPFNVQKAINYVKELGADVESSSEVYIKGKVLSISEISASYGNASFVISDDADGTNKFTAYRVKGFNNKKITDESMLKVGDEVVICGKIVYYRGNTPETVQNTGYIYSVNGETGGGSSGETTAEAKGSGTQADPYNVAGVLKFISTLGADTNSPSEVYIKGKVKEVTEQFNTQYGNGTFTMIDEGYTAIFTAYRILYLGNQKYSSGDGVKEGDEVIVCGKVVNYRGNTPETVQGSSYLYSLNGKTAEGSSPEPSTSDAKGSGTQTDPYNVAAIIQEAAKLASGETSESEYYFKGKISNVKYTFSADYGTATFSISDDGTTNNQFLIYSTYYLDNKAWVEGDQQVAVGDEVIICGKLTNYNGTLETASKKSYIYSLTKGGNSGGSESGGQSGGEVSGSTLSVTFADLGLANQEKPSSLTLSDGTTLTFDAGGNSNAPAYYNTGTALRMYPKNTITINAGSKKIAAIELSCDEYNGTLYNASGDVTVDGNNMTISGSSLKYTGPNASTATVANTSSTTGSASQIRIKILKITYAQ